MRRIPISDGNVRHKIRALTNYGLDRRTATLRRIRSDMVYGYDKAQKELISRARDLGIDEVQIVQAVIEGHRFLERRR